MHNDQAVAAEAVGERFPLRARPRESESVQRHGKILRAYNGVDSYAVGVVDGQVGGDNAVAAVLVDEFLRVSSRLCVGLPVPYI